MSSYAWAVVGAGPAGILAVGRLLDAGVSPQDIFWVDPAFKVGDFGQSWFAVPSNTRVKLFKQFLKDTLAFRYSECPRECSLSHLADDATCLLAEMVKPLQWITDHFRALVTCETAYITHLQRENSVWKLASQTKKFFAKKVILALGAVPKTIDIKLQEKVLPLKTALNIFHLQKLVKAKEHVLIFGGSHSAVLAMKHCLTLACRVTNIYRSPLRYAVFHADHTVFDNTGLKGQAADFAREYLDCPDLWGESFSRHALEKCSQESMMALLKEVDHVVYALGFSKRVILSSEINVHDYDEKTGIIAANLFGLGIAYPEKIIDRYGVHEYNVGLMKFSNYLTRVLPLWMNDE